MLVVAVFVAVVFVYSLLSGRLERTVLTAPILFTAAGALLASVSPEALAEFSLDRKGFLLVAELGLVMTLFHDSTQIRLASLKGSESLPARLLSAGMLLTIALGALAARLVFPGLSWWEAGILSSILAPTDAGLGAAIVESPKVPARIRQALNVEAGLNDGLSVPFLMFFLALALQSKESGGAVLGRYVVEQLGYGALIGLGVGVVGGWLLGRAQRLGWMDAPFGQLGLVALPLACFLLSEATGASMFIAAFVAGLSVQPGFADAGERSVEFTEDWGQLFDLLVFFLFGILLSIGRGGFAPSFVLYAVLSLTVVRMLPVALSLLGTGLSPPTVLFMGWFGPRGLASIVLGLVYLEEQAQLPGEPIIRVAVLTTVAMSILAHGLSAGPGISAYARRVASLGEQAPEFAEPPGGHSRKA
jgi:sodium/hydrogen antiporter